VLKGRVKEIDFVGVGVGVRRQEGAETRFHIVECVILEGRGKFEIVNKLGNW